MTCQGDENGHTLFLLLDDASQEFKDFFTFHCLPSPPPATCFFPLDVEVSSVQELSVEKYK